ncbi:TonB-dependent receptor domain-containing protein [Sphingomonas colocasiae]|uniref:TonB-dependent receptor n=1 Tax=Sphingomonas colocasiae TaxID=1848973 RepID=A0ABS7PPT7_9SPHN|nr:TonB-dependent receptor [Sphingomonas colocasiae]MBY8823328.1 TonB-dependent receptor [Sphingomonas colocasiae]MBY8826463.1 TonB-dependent receptor [Sphingomonas colocasiae]
MTVRSAFMRATFSHASRAALAVALATPALIALAPAAHAQQAADAAQRFDIPAGDLTAALQAFSARTGIQLGYPSGLTAGKRSGGVSGEMSARQALSRLLAGTGLSAQMSGNNATIVQAGAAGEVAAQDGERVLGPVRVEGDQGSGVYQAPVRGEGIAQLGGVRGGQDQEADGYRAKVASITTGAPVAIEDIPRSISVVTQEQIEKQDITTLGDALRRSPGVILTDEPTNEGKNQILVRGLPVTSFAVDGVSTGPARTGAADTNSMNIFGGRLSLDQYERVEIVRGPNALFAGAGSPGGSINLVRKRPGAVPMQSLTVEGGSFGRYGAVADVSTPSLFGSPIAFRAVVSGRNETTPYDDYQAKNASFYGIFDAPLGDDGRLEWGGSYTIANTDGYSPGAFRALNGSLLDLPRTFAPNIENIYSRDRSWNIFGKLFVEVADDWNIEIGADYRGERGRGVSVSPALSFREDGTVPDAYKPYSQLLMVERVPSSGSNLSVMSKITGKFDTFGISHNVFSMISYYSNTNGGLSSGEAYTTAFAPIPSIDALRNPEFTYYTGVNVLSSYYIKDTQSSGLGLVIGDTVNVGDIVEAGITARRDSSSYGNIRISDDPLLPRGSVIYQINTSYRNETSDWRFGYNLSLKPVRGFTLYGSYADGFYRQDGLYSRSGEAGNYSYQQLDPVSYKNKEAGLRYSDKNMSLSASVYKQSQHGIGRIEGNPILACPPGISGSNFASTCYAVGGENMKSKGFDFEASGRISAELSFLVNYAYNKSKFSSSSPISGRNFSEISPQSSGNIFIDWSPSFLRGVDVQLGARYKSKYYSTGSVFITDRDPGSPTYGEVLGSEDYIVNQKPWMVFDVGLGYQLTNNISANVFIQNIADKKYFTSPSPSGGYYGAPRSFMASVKWQRRGLARQDGRSPTTGLAPFGEPSDWYAGFGVGTSLAGSIHAVADGKAQDGMTPVAWNFETKNKPAYVFQLGTYLTGNLRGELEGQYRNSGWGRIGGADVAPYGVCGAVNAAAGQPFDCNKVPGKIESIALMANLIYEFGARDAVFKPFVGAGAGIARHNVQLFGKMAGIGPDSPDNWRARFDRQAQEPISGVDVGYDLTWQVLAGASLALTDRLRLDGTWRYTSIPGLKWDTFNLDTRYRTYLPLTPRVGTFKGDYDSHLITMGLRWAFGSKKK